MSGTAEQIKPTAGQEVGDNQANSLKLKKIDRLNSNQRQWRDNVMKVLGLKSTSSQGRVLAGAIANAEFIQKSQYSEQDKSRARELRKTVMDAGTPPWKDITKSERAGNAKAELDLLTLPPNERKLKQLGGGVNASYFIERKDADDTTRKSFVCKPAGVPTGLELDAPSGAPKGGEVAREALSNRAAQSFLKNTGIDIGMPDTHVISMDCRYIPGREDEAGQSVLCSAQEFRTSGGQLGNVMPDQNTSFNKEQLAGLAIFDTLTLNTDRHTGNLLRGEDNRLIPIDHGESFAENNKVGVSRIKATIGSPHNALLRLPGAHEQMPPEMIRNLSAMSADSFSKDLAKDSTAIGDEYPGMKNMVSAGAIENARRATRFVKLAVRNNPPLSPAAIQIAMGNAADQLFGADIDERSFETNALRVIQQAAPYQEAFKAICTTPNAEYALFAKKAADRGWLTQPRGAKPSDRAINDPRVLMHIVANQLDAPPGGLAAQRKAIAAIMNGTDDAPPTLIPPAQMISAVLMNRKETIADLINAVPDTDQPAFQKAMSNADNLPNDGEKNKAFDRLLVLALKEAMKEQQGRFDNTCIPNKIKELVDAKFDTGEPLVGDSSNKYFRALFKLDDQLPVEAKTEIDNLIQAIGDGEFAEAACDKVRQALETLADTAGVPEDDVDLVNGLDEAGDNKPLEALAYYNSLKKRFN